MKLNKKPRNRPTYVGPNYLFVRGTKVIKRRGLSVQYMVLESQISICKNRNFNPYLTLNTKVNLKSIIDLHLIPQTITFLKENNGEHH